jgi:hypothetical protein
MGHTYGPLPSFTMTTGEIDTHNNIIQQVDSHHNTITNVGRDHYTYNIHHHHPSPPVEASGSSSNSWPSFNDAPLDLLSAHFTGRRRELARISEILDVVHEDVPTRCVIHGMPGLGKTQLALQFAKSSYGQQRYSLIFWVSAATVEKLNVGFAKILDIVHHPDRFRLVEQSGKLTEARRWLEDCSSVNWLLVLDNVDINAIDFIREHLPRKNRRGNILCTTRTESVASALACVAGQQYQPLELGLPDAQDAVHLFLKESGTDAISDASKLNMSKAEEVVKCVGHLPLAVSHAASFMKESSKKLDDILTLLQAEHKLQVRAVTM